MIKCHGLLLHTPMMALWIGVILQFVLPVFLPCARHSCRCQGSGSKQDEIQILSLSQQCSTEEILEISFGIAFKSMQSITILTGTVIAWPDNPSYSQYHACNSCLAPRRKVSHRWGCSQLTLSVVSLPTACQVLSLLSLLSHLLLSRLSPVRPVKLGSDVTS